MLGHPFRFERYKLCSYFQSWIFNPLVRVNCPRKILNGKEVRVASHFKGDYILFLLIPSFLKLVEYFLKIALLNSEQLTFTNFFPYFHFFNGK